MSRAPTLSSRSLSFRFSRSVSISEYWTCRLSNRVESFSISSALAAASSLALAIDSACSTCRAVSSSWTLSNAAESFSTSSVITATSSFALATESACSTCKAVSSSWTLSNATESFSISIALAAASSFALTRASACSVCRAVSSSWTLSNAEVREVRSSRSCDLAAIALSRSASSFLAWSSMFSNSCCRVSSAEAISWMSPLVSFWVSILRANSSRSASILMNSFCSWSRDAACSPADPSTRPATSSRSDCRLVNFSFSTSSSSQVAASASDSSSLSTSTAATASARIWISSASLAAPESTCAFN
mmetsp:Transcript_22036/g.58704  ORF Transcript_22036/g.58704 Transcript_22036/m.58704 type:complete len:305 (-) Transcript_22036:2322-3236(-)